MSSLVSARGVSKHFGQVRAVDDVSFDIEQGKILGLIGPNGAGKTTTMRIIATLLNPTWGEAYVSGYSIYTKPKEIRRIIGYMPDFFGVYDNMKVIEYLEFFAAAYRIKGPTRRKICDEVLELVEARISAVEASPRDGEARGRLGVAYEANRDYDNAIRQYEEALVLFPEYDHGLSPDEITIAEVLKTRGYHTACIGFGLR